MPPTAVLYDLLPKLLIVTKSVIVTTFIERLLMEEPSRKS